MKVSYFWLGEYIDEELPPVFEAVESLTMHSFEIEGVEETGDDRILDVKILPNRAHDCLSHYGIASELASTMSLKRKVLLPEIVVPKSGKIKLSIETKQCHRAVMILITGVKVAKSPRWLEEALESPEPRSPASAE